MCVEWAWPWQFYFRSDWVFCRWTYGFVLFGLSVATVHDRDCGHKGEE